LIEDRSKIPFPLCSAALTLLAGGLMGYEWFLEIIADRESGIC
jgi:hypothetical protein